MQVPMSDIHGVVGFDRGRRTAAVALLLICFVCLVGHTQAQVVPLPRGPVAGERPQIRGLAKGFEKVFAITQDRSPHQETLSGALRREIVRQATLIAAEEELGLCTLDDSIGETIPAGDAAAGPFAIKVAAVMRKPGPGEKPWMRQPFDCSITLTRPDFKGIAFSWTSPAFILLKLDDYEVLVEQMEVLSRGPFVEALQKAGFEKRNLEAVQVPDPKLAHRMDFVSQFATVRYLHSRLRTGQDEAEALEGLVRAYANLGSLTDFHWSPAAKAFKARSLLYSQRLITKHGSTPSSLAHRAYAEALAGRHAAASRAVQDAFGATGKEAPEWLPLIEAYCDYLPEVLEKTKGSNQELAQYLRTNMIDLRFNLVQSTATIQNLLKVNPACIRDADLLASLPTFGTQRIATEVVFGHCWPAVYERLAAIPDLPEAARKSADALKGKRPDPKTEATKRQDVTAQLLASSTKSSSGPAWSAMGSMLREAAFAQAWRTLSSQANNLGVRSDPLVLRQKALVAGHPLEKLLECFASNVRFAEAALQQFNLTDVYWCLDVASSPLPRESHDARDGIDRIINEIDFNTDELYEDACYRRALPYAGPYAPKLSVITPQWPEAVAENIRLSGKAPLALLEKKYPTSGQVLQALYARHLRDDRVDDAKRCLLKAIEISPNGKSYLELAKIYEEEGDREKWQQALEKALKIPNLDLEHVTAHVELADRFMRQGKWPLAKPHVLKAVESGTNVGLLAGARYEEGVENWVGAEKHRQRVSTRNSNAPVGWYFWCLRTGRGKMKEAKAKAGEYWKSRGKSFVPEERWELATVAMIDGDLPTAVTYFKELINSSSKAGLYAAVLYDEKNDAAARDEWFQKVAAGRTSPDPFNDLADIMKGVLSGKEATRWNPVALDVLALHTPEADVSDLYYLAGKFLEKNGDAQLSKDYLQIAATPFQTENLAAALAADMLRKKKVAVGKARLNTLPDAIAPQVELIARNEWARKNGKNDLAEAALNQLLKSEPKSVAGLLARASLSRSQQRYPAARTDLEEVIKIAPNYTLGYQELSRLLSTCPQDAVRDGAKALEYAEKVMSLRQAENADSLKTLAWAFAETGNFEKAVELETQVSRIPGRMDAGVNERLALFRSGRPYRRYETAPSELPNNVGSFQTARVGVWVNLLEWTDGLDWAPLGVNWNEHLEATPSKQQIVLRPEAFRRFPLAATVDGSYDLEVEFKRTSGNGPVAVYFPVGIHTMRLTLDAEGSASVSYVDGNEIGKRQVTLANDKVYKVHVRVTLAGEKSEFHIDWDGTRDFIKWDGDLDALRNIDLSDWSTNMIRRPWIGSNGCRLVLQSARLKMLDGIIRRDPMTDQDRQQDLKEGFVRLVGQPLTEGSVEAWTLCINQIAPEVRGNGAEVSWPMITQRFRFCDNYIGAHAPSQIACNAILGMKSLSVIAYNAASRDTKFRVVIDGQDVYSSHNTGFAVIKVDVPPKSKRIELIVDPLEAHHYDHAYWCYPRFHPEPANKIEDDRLDSNRSKLTLRGWTGNAEAGVTYDQPIPGFQTGPISFRNLAPCDEFIFAHAASSMKFQVPEGMTRFTAIGYNVMSQMARYEVLADDVRVFQSAEAGIVPIDVRLPANTKTIQLKIDACGDITGDHAIWCYPRLNKN
ncbi:MAG: Tetratricopeptide repeat protein [Schlesneria sp.]|nr:Tetratricopeptide repeat protein [Schlesneria sp.]